MAFEKNAAKLAEAIEHARLRIAERELRIAYLDEIGADTWVLRESLATSRQNLELLEYLHKLAQSYAELAAAKHADLVARTGIVLPLDGFLKGAPAPTPPDVAFPPPASAPAGRDPRDGASGSPRKA